MTKYILKEKGKEVISEKHERDFKGRKEEYGSKNKKTESFTDVDFRRYIDYILKRK